MSAIHDPTSTAGATATQAAKIPTERRIGRSAPRSCRSSDPERTANDPRYVTVRIDRPARKPMARPVMPRSQVEQEHGEPDRQRGGQQPEQNLAPKLQCEVDDARVVANEGELDREEDDQKVRRRTGVVLLPDPEREERLLEQEERCAAGDREQPGDRHRLGANARRALGVTGADQPPSPGMIAETTIATAPKIASRT